MPNNFSKTDVAIPVIRKMKESSKMEIARELHRRHPKVWHTVKQAYGTVSYATGTVNTAKTRQARKSKGDADVLRPVRKSTWKKSFPPSSATPWVPIELERPSVILSLSDLHIPYHDQRAIETAVKFAKKRHKITTLLLNGDFADFYNISRWQKNPEARDFSHELNVQRESLEWLARTFPKARRIYKVGNHDQRWDLYIWNNAPQLAGCDVVQLQTILKFDKYGFERVDDQPIMAGKLPILHGHEFGKSGIAAPVNPARGAFTRTLHSVLVGHLHRSSAHTESDMFHAETSTWSQGCLCNMTPEYARVNKWNQGFAVVEVAKDGMYNVFNYRLGGDYAVRQS